MTKVLGMGNALVDVLTQLPDDSILHALNLPKGSMQLVNADFMNRAIEQTSNLPRTLAAGGSAANTINGLANLGINTSFVGKIGPDATGQTFDNDMRSNGINPLLLNGTAQTGRALVLVSPDSERTFATHLGAAIELTPTDIRPEMFTKADYFYIEGYLVQNHDLVRHALELAHRANLKIALDLASYNVVEDNREFLREMLQKHVNIVFANEEEARAFGGNSADETLEQLSALTDVAVVKLGSAGSIMRRGDEFARVGVSRVDKLVDTTGAGDMYAAGFIYGLCQNRPLAQCGELGAIISGAIIGVMGPKMNADRWQQVHQQVRELMA